MELESSAFDPAVEFAILADAVQASGGKLFVLGGGWDTLFCTRFPARHPSLGIGLRLRVPWTWADQRVTISVELQDEDGHSLFPKDPLSHAFMVGRPRGLPEGSDIGLVRAFTFHNLAFPRPGAYSFVVSINDQVRERLRFSVRQRA